VAHAPQFQTLRAHHPSVSLGSPLQACLHQRPSLPRAQLGAGAPECGLPAFSAGVRWLRLRPGATAPGLHGAWITDASVPSSTHGGHGRVTVKPPSFFLRAHRTALHRSLQLLPCPHLKPSPFSLLLTTTACSHVYFICSSMFVCKPVLFLFLPSIHIDRVSRVIFNLSANSTCEGHNRPVRLGLPAESAAIQQCFSLTPNQRTVISAQ
jgi:hypothetical protein